MPAVRGSLCRRSRLSHPAVRGSLCRRSRLSHPAVRGSLRRRSRLSHPAVRGTSCRRSRLSDPAVRGSWRRRSRLSHPAVRGSSCRRSRIIQPSVPRGWRLHPWLTLAHRPASDSMPAGLPLTQCPPACLWLNARRPASDLARQECRWLKFAGLPLTQARRIAADSSSPDCRWLMPLVVGREGQLTTSLFHAAIRGPPVFHVLLLRGESQPAVRGSLGPQPTEAPSSPPAPAVVWSSPPAAAIICQASRLWYPQTAAAVLTSQPAVAVFDQTVTTVFLTVCVCLAPEGSWYPWASPRKFWGGVVGLRPKRLRWGLGPRSRKRSHHGLPSSRLRHGLPSSLFRHGLPSSLLHLDLGLSVPLWRPRSVYVSVSVLWGLQSAHPPSLVVLLRHGTCLPGGGSYVRDLSCASCGSRLLFLYLVCFLSVVIIVYSCHLLC